MKLKTKIISVLVLLSLISVLFCSTLSVCALETYFEANLKGEKYAIKGEKYNLLLTFENFQADEFLGATALIDYDSEVFDITSCTIINPEEKWEIWTDNQIAGAESIFSLTVVYGGISEIVSLKGDSVSCLLELTVKDDAKSSETVIKIDSDEDLDGAFSETLIEKKYGKGSTLTVSVYDTIPDFILKEDSKIYFETSKITSLNVLTAFNEKTTVADFIANFENPSEYLKIVFEGNILSENDFVPTSSEIQLVANDKVLDSALLVCRGDVDGNGIVNSTDYLRIKSYFLGTLDLHGASLAGADLDNSGAVDTTDYLKIKSYFLGFIETLN